MSRTGCRQAIATFLNSAQISYVGAVYEARPIILPEQDYEQRMLNGVVTQITSTNGSGCVLVVNIVGDRRQRLALTGRQSVNDMTKHEIAIEVWFACNGDPNNGAGAQEDYDAIVNAIFVAVRSDPTLGTGGQTPGSIWSAGEYEPWMQHEQAMPQTADGGLTVTIQGVIKFEAWENDVGASGTI